MLLAIIFLPCVLNFLFIPLIYCSLKSTNLHHYWMILRAHEYMIANYPVIYLMNTKRSNIGLVPTCQVSATSLSLIPSDVLVKYSRLCSVQSFCVSSRREIDFKIFCNLVISTITKACTRQVYFS
jgi:hypothetical protein